MALAALALVVFGAYDSYLHVNLPVSYCLQAAQKFYTLLVLKKHQVLELQQEYSYGEILVSRGKKFDNPSL